jgi:hypothetical protein
MESGEQPVQFLIQNFDTYLKTTSISNVETIPTSSLEQLSKNLEETAKNMEVISEVKEQSVESVKTVEISESKKEIMKELEIVSEIKAENVQEKSDVLIYNPNNGIFNTKSELQSKDDMTEEVAKEEIVEKTVDTTEKSKKDIITDRRILFNFGRRLDYYITTDKKVYLCKENIEDINTISSRLIYGPKSIQLKTSSNIIRKYGFTIPNFENVLYKLYNVKSIIELNDKLENVLNSEQVEKINSGKIYDFPNHKKLLTLISMSAYVYSFMVVLDYLLERNKIDNMNKNSDYETNLIKVYFTDQMLLDKFKFKNDILRTSFSHVRMYFYLFNQLLTDDIKYNIFHHITVNSENLPPLESLSTIRLRSRSPSPAKESIRSRSVSPAPSRSVSPVRKEDNKIKKTFVKRTSFQSKKSSLPEEDSGEVSEEDSEITRQREKIKKVMKDKSFKEQNKKIRHLERKKTKKPSYEQSKAKKSKKSSSSDEDIEKFKKLIKSKKDKKSSSSEEKVKAKKTRKDKKSSSSSSEEKVKAKKIKSRKSSSSEEKVKDKKTRKDKKSSSSSSEEKVKDKKIKTKSSDLVQKEQQFDKKYNDLLEIMIQKEQTERFIKHQQEIEKAIAQKYGKVINLRSESSSEVVLPSSSISSTPENNLSLEMEKFRTDSNLINSAQLYQYCENLLKFYNQQMSTTSKAETDKITESVHQFQKICHQEENKLHKLLSGMESSVSNIVVDIDKLKDDLRKDFQTKITKQTAKLSDQISKSVNLIDDKVTEHTTKFSTDTSKSITSLKKEIEDNIVNLKSEQEKQLSELESRKHQMIYEMESVKNSLILAFQSEKDKCITGLDKIKAKNIEEMTNFNKQSIEILNAQTADIKNSFKTFLQEEYSKSKTSLRKDLDSHIKELYDSEKESYDNLRKYIANAASTKKKEIDSMFDKQSKSVQSMFDKQSKTAENMFDKQFEERSKNLGIKMADMSQLKERLTLIERYLSNLPPGRADSKKIRFEDSS